MLASPGAASSVLAPAARHPDRVASASPRRRSLFPATAGRPTVTAALGDEALLVALDHLQRADCRLRPELRRQWSRASTLPSRVFPGRCRRTRSFFSKRNGVVLAPPWRTGGTSTTQVRRASIDDQIGVAPLISISPRYDAVARKPVDQRRASPVCATARCSPCRWHRSGHSAVLPASPAMSLTGPPNNTPLISGNAQIVARNFRLPLTCCGSAATPNPPSLRCS